MFRILRRFNQGCPEGRVSEGLSRFQQIRWKAVLGGCLVAVAGAYWLPGQQPQPIPITGKQPMPNSVARESSAILMRAKLASSQRVVEGLMAGDFAMIAKGGSELQRICDSEAWRQHEDPILTHYRSELKRGGIKLMKLANEENLEGAAYTYMHTLTACINCHEYSRNVLRIASAKSPVVPIPATERENAAYVRDVLR